MAEISARALPGIPEVRAGDDLAELIVSALGGQAPGGGELVAIAHTAVSKAEGAVVELERIAPGERALALAREAPGDSVARSPVLGTAAAAKDPRAVQVVLDESVELLRAERGVLICRTRHGFVCANAGVDASNAAPGTVIVLPRDPDASARRIRARFRELGAQAAQDGGSEGGRAPAVLITDSFGRAWRHGQLDVAIGVAGLRPLEDWRGRCDASGLQLRATWLAVADAAAAAADLARTKVSGEPVVVIDGLGRHIRHEDGPGAAALLRPVQEDLFR